MEFLMNELIFNAKALEIWKEVDESNWQFIVNDIIQTFFLACEKQYQILLEGKNTKNINQIGKAAHTLKSSCGYVGAEKAHFLLEQIESLCQSQKESLELFDCLKEFDAIFFITLQSIKDYQEDYYAAA